MFEGTGASVSHCSTLGRVFANCLGTVLDLLGAHLSHVEPPNGKAGAPYPGPLIVGMAIVLHVERGSPHLG